MTGEEFLQKVREIKEISNIRWDVKGFCLNADEVYIQITTDKEAFSLWLGNPAECKDKADLLDSTWCHPSNYPRAVSSDYFTAVLPRYSLTFT